ncbi:MAG TPA: restriction endonuclease subunit S [Methanocorpusculum sp.]|nr:restriction endonuclease subunit S [Methanocorpusculum sp.]HJK42597.1 restriction endonuclease subunit S [Methanocorpusculum sp.]
MGHVAEGEKEKWPKARLGDVAKISSGGTPSRSNPEFWDNGTIPWVKIGDIEGKYINDTEEYITVSGLKNSSAKLFPKGTLLYTIFATLGEVSILNIDAATNQAIAGIQFDDSVDTDYAYYFLLSLKDVVKNTGRGVAQNNINQAILKNIQLSLPPLDEQRRIAAVLDKVSGLIAKRRQQLEMLDELVKARFVEMFGTFPANENNWPVGKIRDVIKEARYGSSRPAVDGGQYPYLRMNNITYGGYLDLSNIKQIDVPESELPKCSVQRGDVLFNRTNSKELVGKTCVYDRDEQMVLAGFIIRIRVNKHILPEFLSGFLNTDFSKQMLLGMCKTAIGQANINAQEMQNIGIYIPPIGLQQEFVDYHHQVKKTKTTISRSLDKLETLKKSLMQEYFG